jgi:antitoxin component of MazEF toxin-antitoxin module
MDIQFKATIRKVGNSAMITIPSEYIDAELKVGEDYFFTVKTNGQTVPEVKEATQ